MSASKKQQIANKKNAQKSTGPKSDSGKAVASKNALKHGITSRDVIINTPRLKENPVDYELLVESLISELDPQSLFQKCLVEKLANCLWRHRRVVIAETAQISDQINNISSNTTFFNISDDDDDDEFTDDTDTEEYDEDNDPEMVYRIGIKSIPKESFCHNLMRYEMRLDRQLTRTYKLLKQLQLQNKANSIHNDYLDSFK